VELLATQGTKREKRLVLLEVRREGGREGGRKGGMDGGELD